MPEFSPPSTLSRNFQTHLLQYAPVLTYACQAWPRQSACLYCPRPPKFPLAADSAPGTPGAALISVPRAWTPGLCLLARSRPHRDSRASPDQTAWAGSGARSARNVRLMRRVGGRSGVLAGGSPSSVHLSGTAHEPRGVAHSAEERTASPRAQPRGTDPEPSTRPQTSTGMGTGGSICTQYYGYGEKCDTTLAKIRRKTPQKDSTHTRIRVLRSNKDESPGNPIS